jgi:hypothetical protein
MSRQLPRSPTLVVPPLFETRSKAAPKMLARVLWRRKPPQRTSLVELAFHPGTKIVRRPHHQAPMHREYARESACKCPEVNVPVVRQDRLSRSSTHARPHFQGSPRQSSPPVASDHLLRLRFEVRLPIAAKRPLTSTTVEIPQTTAYSGCSAAPLKRPRDVARMVSGGVSTSDADNKCM